MESSGVCPACGTRLSKIVPDGSGTFDCLNCRARLHQDPDGAISHDKQDGQEQRSSDVVLPKPSGYPFAVAAAITLSVYFLTRIVMVAISPSVQAVPFVGLWKWWIHNLVYIALGVLALLVTRSFREMDGCVVRLAFMECSYHGPPSQPPGSMLPHLIPWTVLGGLGLMSCLTVVAVLPEGAAMIRLVGPVLFGVLMGLVGFALCDLCRLFWRLQWAACALANRSAMYLEYRLFDRLFKGPNWIPLMCVCCWSYVLYRQISERNGLPVEFTRSAWISSFLMMGCLLSLLLLTLKLEGLVVLWEEVPIRNRSTMVRVPATTAWYVRLAGLLGWAVAVALVALVVWNCWERMAWVRSPAGGELFTGVLIALFLGVAGLSTLFWMYRLVSLIGRCGSVAENILDRRKDASLPSSWFGVFPLAVAVLAIALSAVTLDCSSMGFSFRLQLAQEFLTTYGVVCVCAACAEALRVSHLLKAAVNP